MESWIVHPVALPLQELASTKWLLCITYYISSIHNHISIQWYYIQTQVTLWQHVSTVRRSSSGQWRTLLRYNKVSTQWDPISFTVYFNALVINKNFIISYFNFYYKRNGIPFNSHLIYLKNVLYWPEDDHLTVETCCHNVTWLYV